MKYVFKPHNAIFPKLFLKEKRRLEEQLGDKAVIEHVGSSAVPNLGGKGIIDIAIGAKRKSFKEISKALKELGYEFKPNAGVEKRLFFQTKRPDPLEKERLYHVHLTDISGEEWKRMLAFRGYLRIHPEDVRAYAKAKKNAADASNQDKDTYMGIKDPVIKAILKKALKK